MVLFSPNPLSLSLSDSAFDSWLRERGYLELLDELTSAPPSSTSPSPSPPSARAAGAAACLASALGTAATLVSTNPFSKLSSSDFAGDTPPWAEGFLARPAAYSWPSDPAQARMRVHENVKRYARNYCVLFLVFFSCSLQGLIWGFLMGWIYMTLSLYSSRTPIGSLLVKWSGHYSTVPASIEGLLCSRMHQGHWTRTCLFGLCLIFCIVCRYQMPLALVGLISCLAIWETFRFCSNSWVLERYPFLYQAFLRAIQLVTIVIIYGCKVQIALFCAIGISYAVMLLHASHRKLTLSRQTDRTHKRFQKS